MEKAGRLGEGGVLRGQWSQLLSTLSALHLICDLCGLSYGEGTCQRGLTRLPWLRGHNGSAPRKSPALPGATCLGESSTTPGPPARCPVVWAHFFTCSCGVSTGLEPNFWLPGEKKILSSPETLEREWSSQRCARAQVSVPGVSRLTQSQTQSHQALLGLRSQVRLSSRHPACLKTPALDFCGSVSWWLKSLARPSSQESRHCPLDRDPLAYRMDGNFPVAGNSHQPLEQAA